MTARPRANNRAMTEAERAVRTERRAAAAGAGWRRRATSSGRCSRSPSSPWSPSRAPTSGGCTSGSSPHRCAPSSRASSPRSPTRMRARTTPSSSPFATRSSPRAASRRYYLRLVRGGPIAIPPAFIDAVVAAIVAAPRRRARARSSGAPRSCCTGRSGSRSATDASSARTATPPTARRDVGGRLRPRPRARPARADGTLRLPVLGAGNAREFDARRRSVRVRARPQPRDRQRPRSRPHLHDGAQRFRHGRAGARARALGRSLPRRRDDDPAAAANRRSGVALAHRPRRRGDRAAQRALSRRGRATPNACSA